MGLYEIFINFINEQYVNILIAFGIGLLFFVLTPWGLKGFLKTAELERRNRAKENILDLLEGSLIFKQDMNLKKISHLVSAVGQENTVDVFSYTSSKSLLEELELRFEKSKHLDPNQKQEYTRKIEDMINDLEKKDEGSEIHIPYSELLGDLTKNVNDGNKESALKNIDVFKKILIQRSYDRSSPFFILAKLREDPKMLIITILMYLIIIYIIFFNLKK